MLRSARLLVAIFAKRPAQLDRGGWTMSDVQHTLVETMAEGPVVPSSWDNFGDTMVFAANHGGDLQQLLVAAPQYDQPAASNGGFVMGVIGTGTNTISATPVVDPHGFSLTNGAGFGRAIAAGDFDGDGFDELAIAVPNASIDSQNSAGGVIIRRLWL